MGPLGLGDISVLKILLFGIIFGVTVRFFSSWCASGNRDTNPKDGEDGGSRKTAKNHTTTQSLNIPLLPLAEVNGQEGGRGDVGERRSPGLQSLIDEGISDAAGFPIVPCESWRYEFKPLFDEGKARHGNTLRYRVMDLEKRYGQTNKISKVEPVQDTLRHDTAVSGFENGANKILPTSKVTTLDQPIPFPKPPGQVLYDHPVKPPISYMDATGSTESNNTSALLLSDRPKVRTFYGSEKNNLDASTEHAVEQASVTNEEFLLNIHKGGGNYALFSTSSHKGSSFRGHGINAPRLDIDTTPQQPNRAEQAFTPSQGQVLAQARTTKEVPDICKEIEHRPQPSNVRELSNPIARPPSYSPREFAVIPTPGIVAILPKNQNVDKEGGRLKYPNLAPLMLANPQFNTRQASKNPILELPVDLSQPSLINRRPVPVSFPVAKTLDFTPGSLFRNPRPFGKPSITQAIRTSPESGNPSKKIQATLTIGDGRPMVPHHVNSSRIALRNPLESAVGTNSLLIFQPRRVFTLHESKIMYPDPKTKPLDFTPNDRFRNPRPFPQTSFVFSVGLEDQSNPTKKLGEDLDPSARERLLQNGSLENPMVGRVKLVSKVPGKDPKFTYLTWKSAGAKRSRSPHNCQENGGCRGCD